LKLKFIALNALLLAAITAVVFEARVRLQEAHARRETNLYTAIRPVALPPLASAPKPDAAPAARYADVANKDLFVKDRNPVVIVDPPKVEKPREMPPLPVVYGVLSLPSGVRAIMAEKTGAPSAPYRAGDMIGEFKIAALDPQNITFEWNEKLLTRKIEDLIDRSGPTDASGGGRAVIAAASAPPAGNIQPQAQPQIQPQNNSVQGSSVQGGTPAMGVEIGAPGHSERACTPGDSSPAGTVVDGYRKTTAGSPFGVICRWVPAQ
jgi:hypothetical protein